MSSISNRDSSAPISIVSKTPGTSFTAVRIGAPAARSLPPWPPIAIGERFNSKWDCLPLITNQLIDYVRNPLSKSGGVTELRKIAIIAEPFQVRTAFQGPPDVGPFAFAATVHLDHAISNFGIQEWAEFSPQMHEIFPGLPTFHCGYLHVSDAPGLGVEMDEAALRRFPYQPFYVPIIRREDGSIQDP